MSRGSTRPAPSTGTTVSSHPWRASQRQVSMTDGCSTALVTTRRRGDLPRAAHAPWIARLFDSVPPLVKTISSGAAPIKAAICARAASIRSRAARPGAYGADGFP